MEGRTYKTAAVDPNSNRQTGRFANSGWPDDVEIEAVL
jgi:hypothetical protein